MFGRIAVSILLVFLLTLAGCEDGYQRGLAAYERGDYASALEKWRPLAEQGNVHAAFNLGVMYEKGRGVAQSWPEAAKWYRRAAEKGMDRAQFNLGNSYRYARGIPQDFLRAVKWYRKSAEQGYFQAQTNLGVMYRYGQGVPQDYAEAIKWYRKAADQNDATAQHNVGLMYGKGHGVPQDDTEAVKWYRKAANQGYAQAQANLGRLYMKGQGVQKDYVQALNWFRKATAQGNVSALNDYAWFLATSKEPKFRDGEKAVALALKAVLPKRKSHYLDTLAAAYAEAGKFDEAIRVQKEAVDMLRVSGPKPQLLKKFQERLNLYESGKPYRD